MQLDTLQQKLRQIHPSLYVKTDYAASVGDNLHLSGVYAKAAVQRRMANSSDRHQINIEQQKYLEALDSGQLDQYICGVCLEHIPEYDIFDKEFERIVALGWRTVAMRLIKLGFCSVDRARKVFNCRSLGESDYDKMKMIQKLDWARRISDAK